MPNVRDLEASEPQTATQTTTQTPVDNALALPGAFGGLPMATRPDDLTIPESDQGIYVGFAHPQSPSWASQSAAGCRSGDIFLGFNRQLFPKMPLNFWLMHCEAFKSVILKSGQIVYATSDLTKAVVPPGAQAPPTARLETHMLGVVLVEHDGTFVPAKFDARGTKEGCLVGPLNALKEAMQPDWPRKSEAHKIAAAATFPWLRVKHTATTHPRTAKGTGNEYHLGVAASQPSTLTEMQKIAEVFSDPKFNRNAELAMKAFQQRVGELRALSAQFAEK